MYNCCIVHTSEQGVIVLWEMGVGWRGVCIYHYIPVTKLGRVYWNHHVHLSSVCVYSFVQKIPFELLNLLYLAWFDVNHHGIECQVNKLGCYLQGQGHNEGLYIVKIYFEYSPWTNDSFDNRPHIIKVWSFLQNLQGCWSFCSQT